VTRAGGRLRLDTGLSSLEIPAPLAQALDDAPSMPLSRRQTLFFFGIGGSGWLLGCDGTRSEVPDPQLPNQRPSGKVSPRSGYSDSVDALFDVLLPTERDSTTGLVTSPGARETGADRVLRTENFVRLAIAQGLLKPIAEAALIQLDDLGGATRAALSAQLDALAFLETPLTAFHALPRPRQIAVVTRLFDDNAARPVMEVMRAVCFVSFLGATSSDAGLVAIGFPPFESFEEGRAVSGYPRTRSGRLIDATKENLTQLAAIGELDDYTLNRQPVPTPGDDLSLALDANGELK
jgi:hypothetical protein